MGLDKGVSEATVTEELQRGPQSGSSAFLGSLPENWGLLPTIHRLLPRQSHSLNPGPFPQHTRPAPGATALTTAAFMMDMGF